MGSAGVGEWGEKSMAVLKNNPILFIPQRKKIGATMIRNSRIFGEPCRDRTDNLLIKSQLLYQLS